MEFYEKLSQALVKQAHTLTHIIILAADEGFALLEILTKLHKLKTLNLICPERSEGHSISTSVLDH